MRTNRPYVQIDPDVLERVRQIDLLSYLREFEPSNLVKVKGTSNVYCTAEHDSLKISNGKWYWWSRGFGGYSALDYLIKVKEYDFVEAVLYGGYQGQIPRILQGASCSKKTDGNFKIRKEKPMKNYKSIICVVAAVCLLGTAAFCGFRIYHYYAEVDEQTEAFEEIAEMVEQAPTDETVPDDAPVSEGEDVLAKYQELYLQNEDMVGWISIAGTTINYPVMQSRNNPNFYLKHNFEKEYSDLGTPYVQENCDIAESDNLVIYGHHIKGGKMFGALEDYKSKSFYEEHKNIQFDTLTEQAEYEIVAVFKTVAYSSEGFRYYDFVDAENEEDFNSYIGKCKELALYDTGVTAGYGDRLITLSTCEYSAQNGRLVVVAKKVG